MRFPTYYTNVNEFNICDSKLFQISPFIKDNAYFCGLLFSFEILK